MEDLIVRDFKRCSWPRNVRLLTAVSSGVWSASSVTLLFMKSKGGSRSTPSHVRTNLSISMRRSDIDFMARIISLKLLLSHVTVVASLFSTHAQGDMTCCAGHGDPAEVSLMMASERTKNKHL